jgi:hypothetical protein
MRSRVCGHRQIAAQQLGVSTGALLRWTRAGQVPAVKLPSGAIRYRPDQIDAWLDERSMADVANRESPETRNHARRPAAYAVPSRLPETPPRVAATTEED